MLFRKPASLLGALTPQMALQEGVLEKGGCELNLLLCEYVIKSI
jgi:hypothetical protein